VPAPFDLLGSASFLVEDRERAASAAQQVLGLRAPKPHWILDTPGRGITVTFLRPGPSTALAPTPIEIVASDEVRPGTDPRVALPLLPAVARSQGARPTKVHATDIAVADIDELLERCRRDGRRHWVKADPLGVRRVWIGFDATNPTDYVPDGDGGLHFEFLPTEALRLPPAAVDASPAAPAAGEGALLGVASRTYLVDDLGRVLDDVHAGFDWSPDEPIGTGAGGTRRAVLGFRFPTSTRLELIEPHGATEDADALARWGPGAWAIVIGVDGLDAKADDLRARGVAFRELPTGFEHPARLLRIAAAQTPGCLFDLVDVGELAC